MSLSKKLTCKGSLRTKFTNTSGPVLKNHILVPIAKMMRVVLSRMTTNRRHRWYMRFLTFLRVQHFGTRGRILGRNWDKVLKSFPLWYSQSPILKDPPPPEAKMVFIVNIVYGRKVMLVSTAGLDKKYCSCHNAKPDGAVVRWAFSYCHIPYTASTYSTK